MTLYTEENLIFQRSIRQFAEKEIYPFVTKWEEEENFPSEIFKKLAASGFLSILIPEHLGGIGGDYTMAAAWVEEFGRIPTLGFTTAINMHSLVITPALARFGSAEALAKWIPSALAGTAIGAYAFTEPNAGSDLSQIQTKAVKEKNFYRLSGSKIFITNGARADFVIVLAKTSADHGYNGFSSFVVDTKSAGFSVSRKLSKLGWHCSDTAELVFDNVIVPETMLLGKEGEGWKQAMASLEWERVMLTLNSIAGATHCLEQTITYIKDRKVFGKRIADYDLTQERIAAYWSKLQAVRSYAHYVIRLLNEKKPCKKEASLAKLNATELAIELADKCLQMHGGYGYTTEFLPERWLRDLRLNTIGGGTTEIMARIAGRELLK